MFFLQNRWKLQGRTLYYYGLRNRENLLRRRIRLTRAQCKLISSLPRPLTEKELRILSPLPGPCAWGGLGYLMPHLCISRAVLVETLDEHLVNLAVDVYFYDRVFGKCRFYKLCHREVVVGFCESDVIAVLHNADCVVLFHD